MYPSRVVCNTADIFPQGTDLLRVRVGVAQICWTELDTVTTADRQSIAH